MVRAAVGIPFAVASDSSLPSGRGLPSGFLPFRESFLSRAPVPGAPPGRRPALLAGGVPLPQARRRASGGIIHARMRAVLLMSTQLESSYGLKNKTNPLINFVYFNKCARKTTKWRV